MARVCSVRMGLEGVNFTYTINVDGQGLFSTTLPKDIVLLFNDAQLKMGINKLHNKGYFCADNISDLKEQVGDILKEYCSRELKSEEIIIRYAIRTDCNYCLKDEDVVPNGYYTGDDDYDWKTGNSDHFNHDNYPYGLSVYAEPFTKKVYSYKSGKEKTDYECYSAHEMNVNDKSTANICWLASLVHMGPPDDFDTDIIREIKYTEKTAEFFVNLVKSICNINERIKDLLEPESIQKLIDNNQKLLN